MSILLLNNAEASTTLSAYPLLDWANYGSFSDRKTKTRLIAPQTRLLLLHYVDFIQKVLTPLSINLMAFSAI